eukprot:m.115529 g.115529  ORF g.115529 m.115529 type:complete len:248 (+) comp10881_c0_seq1:94-837(+)
MGAQRRVPAHTAGNTMAMASCRESLTSVNTPRETKGGGSTKSKSSSYLISDEETGLKEQGGRDSGVRPSPRRQSTSSSCCEDPARIWAAARLDTDTTNGEGEVNHGVGPQDTRHRTQSSSSLRGAQLTLQANDDPGVWLVKEAENFGRQHRRWFVLHRRDREFAYYEHAFIPPRTAKRKGAIHLNNITGVSCTGNRLEISVAKGRRMFRLYADDPLEARHWACVLKMATERIVQTTSRVDDVQSVVK